MKNKIKTIIPGLLLLIFFILPGTITAFGETYSGRKEAVDIIFVVDHSNSMNRRDRNQLVLKAIRTFITDAYSENLWVGYVAYNDEILAFANPVPMNDNQEKLELKAFLTGIPYAGYTDIGMALSFAEGLAKPREERKTVIILISDGEIDLADSLHGEAEEKSEALVQEVIRACIKKEIPIYAIAYDQNGNYDGNKELLEKIGTETKGGYYEIDDDHALLSFLYDEICNYTGFSLWSGIQLENSFGYQMLSPMLMMERTIAKGETTELQIALWEKEIGGHWDKADFYRRLSGEMVLYQVGDDERTEVVRKALTGDEEAELMKGQFLLSKTGEYVLTCTLRTEYETYFFTDIPLTVTNNIYQTQPVDSVLITAAGETHTFDLANYFDNAAGEELSFELSKVKGDGDATDIRVADGKLTIQGKKPGDQEVFLQVKNSVDEVVAPVFVITIQPAWRYYFGVFLGIMIVLLIVSVYIIGKLTEKNKQEFQALKPGDNFNGKLRGCLTYLPGADEVHSLAFNLYEIKAKGISLGSLWENLAEPVSLPALKLIYMAPGQNRCLLVWHNSPAAMMINNTMICQNVTYEMHFGDVLYLYLEGEYELELQYMAAVT